MIEVPVPTTWAVGAGTSLSSQSELKSAAGETSQGWAMAGIDTAVEAARRYIIKRPRLTRLLDNANAHVLMLIAPAGFGKTTLAREWVADRPHVWYRGTTATADVAALAAGFAETISEVIPNAVTRAVSRMRATGRPEDDVEIIAELFAEDLADWPSDLWLVFDDYQFAMDAKAPETFVDLVLRGSPLRLLLASRKRPTWASARRLLYGEIYELGRNELAMDHDEAAAVLAHRPDAPAAGLVALAEGWPAVIGLAALAEGISLPEGGLPDALHDYFAEELYQAATPVVQSGLSKLALAPSLGDGIAEYLLGDQASEVIAEALRLGFLSARPSGLELHPLLRAFLASKATHRTKNSETDAKRLLSYLAELGKWDDVFSVLQRFSSESLFIDLLERGLPTFLSRARLSTLSAWLELGRAMRIDSPICDLAEAELAFHEAKRRKAEALALRAAQRLPIDHSLRSRAFYIAGMSARMDFHNSRAKSLFDEALRTAIDVRDRRDATWGELGTSLDLDLPDASQLYEAMVELNDGSASGEIRLAIANFLLTIRKGKPVGAARALLDSTHHLLLLLEEPHTGSSFRICRASALILQGEYEAALTAARDCENYATDVRIPFVLGYARRLRAMAELGMRHFGRCKLLLDWLDREATKCEDVFLQIESRLARARLYIAEGASARAMDILTEAPTDFPFEGERAEWLATQALALACLKNSEALPLAQEAQDSSSAIEVQTLVPLARAVYAVRRCSTDALEAAQQAFETVLNLQSVDPFVIAYRGCPELLGLVGRSQASQKHLVEILRNGHDWTLAKMHGAAVTSRSRTRNATLSKREREVLGLIAQGLTNKQIAVALFVSESTAKVHVRHILAKLDVRTRTEAALLATELAELD